MTNENQEKSTAFTKVQDEIRHQMKALGRLIETGIAGPLEQGGDEAKLQLHLARLEAQDRLDVLEKFASRNLKKMSDAAGAAAEAAALQAALASMDLEDAVQDRTQRARQELRSTGATLSKAWHDAASRLSALAKKIGDEL